MSLLKASINIWNEDISSDADNKNMWSEFEHDLELLESDIDSCMLDEEGVEVVTVIADYIARQTNKNTQCDLCQEILTWNIGNLSSDDSLNKLSWGGLTTPSTDLVHYIVAKSFAILDCAKSILLSPELPTRKLSEYQAANYMFKVNIGNKAKAKHSSGAFIFNFEHISDLVLVFLLLTLSR